MDEPVIRAKNIRPYQICNCCVMDTSDEDITFDSNGVCMRCNEYKERIEPEWNHGKGHEKELQDLITAIKKSGEGKEYDCILGLSGGLDSSYMLHLAVTQWGLRPFVFHIDAGWNLPVAEENIKRLTDKLGVELHTDTMDWNEMREMQLAWFRTGLEMLDAPQDHAFISLIDRYAKELGIKYILNGYNICTEIVADPVSWERGAGPTGDGTYIKDVVKKHCAIPIKNYTYTSGFKHKFVNPYLKGIKTVKPLNLVEFTRASMVETLEKEYGYVPYGQKHFEDLITKFLEGWWQPTRFGHDIRRAQLSSLVVTGQISRDEALKILEQTPLTEDESKELFSEVARRLEISEDELMKLHEMPECTEKFKSQEKLYNFGIRLYEKLGLEKRIRK
ncbi:MAG: N-acetyl sugar amidotransferase [Clostridiales bacterium]|nr:N-acetyl sugar amidotransferase [Clostridiales bacterium]